MSGLDPEIITTIVIFAAGYILSRWDRMGGKQETSSVTLAELRAEMRALRTDVERAFDDLSSLRSMVTKGFAA